MCGVIAGLEKHDLTSTRVLAVETEGADCLHRSKLAGHRVVLSEITSKAKSLGAQQVCERAWHHLSSPLVDACTVTDNEAREACDRFLGAHRVRVELACGAALAAAVEGRHRFVDDARTVLVVVCGGVNP